jgi:hypothetical protein
MICSSENRFFTSNLLALRDWTPDRRATQKRGDVGRTTLNDPDCDQVARKFVMGSNGWVMSNDVNVTVCSSGVR